MLIVSHNTGWYKNKIGYSVIHSLFVKYFGLIKILKEFTMFIVIVQQS
jgi:hypothetical protein